MDHTSTVSASVYRDATGGWMLALEGPTTEIVETVQTEWDGSGTFYDEGLNLVAPLLAARGLAYNTPWAQFGDRYTVAVHGRANWGRG
jgi:hypothetical protein